VNTDLRPFGNTVTVALSFHEGQGVKFVLHNISNIYMRKLCLDGMHPEFVVTFRSDHFTDSYTMTMNRLAWFSTASANEWASSFSETL